MSTAAHILALLGDLAGARDVLQDARLEERPAELLANLERVRQEAEDALWDGGGVGMPVISSMRGSRMREWALRPGRRDGDGRRNSTRLWLGANWLEWDNSGAAMGRSWAPGFYGIPRGMAGPMASFADVYRAPYATLDEAAVDIASAGRETDVIYMNPENYRLYQEEFERSVRDQRIRGTGALRVSAVDRSGGTITLEAQRRHGALPYRPRWTSGRARPSHPDDIFLDGRVWSRNLVPIPVPGPIGGHLYEDDEENA